MFSIYNYDISLVMPEKNVIIFLLCLFMIGYSACSSSTKSKKRDTVIKRLVIAMIAPAIMLMIYSYTISDFPQASSKDDHILLGIISFVSLLFTYVFLSSAASDFADWDTSSEKEDADMSVLALICSAPALSITLYYLVRFISNL